MASDNNTGEKARDYQIPASDNRGHSIRISFRASPQMGMQVELILGSKKFPYRTDGELYRHALENHLKLLMTSADGVESMIPQMEAISEVVRMSEMQRQFGEVVGRVVTEATSLASGGHVKEARKLADKIMKQVEKMPDTYWRDIYRKEMRAKLGHLMSRPAGLHPGDTVREEE